MIGTLVGAVAASRTRRRRARNLRAGARAQAAARPAPSAPARAWSLVRMLRRQDASGDEAARTHGQTRTPADARRPDAHAPAEAHPLQGAGARTQADAPLRWLTVGCVLLALAGAALIVVHARWLAAAGVTAPDDGAARFASVLPGLAFTVPDGVGTTVRTAGDATLLILSGLRAGAAHRIDLCDQLADRARPGRLLPLRIGWPFAAVAGLDAPRNVLLAADGDDVPRVRVDGRAGAGVLDVRWDGGAQWVDARGAAPGQSATLRGEGWLTWPGGALRLRHVTGGTCAPAGELLVQTYRRGPTSQSPAVALPAAGMAVEARLAPGDYRVPAAPPPALEDAQLFEQLRARGLVRLGANGLAELAPPDLAAWRAAGRTPWDDVLLDGDALRLLERLYRRADGEFVREQVRIFNAERRLLAWRVNAGTQGTWRADAVEDAAPLPPSPAAGAGARSMSLAVGTKRVDAQDATGTPQAPPAAGAHAAAGPDVRTSPVPLADDMPPSGARLFARLPQGWAPWQRVAAWPARAGAARLAFTPARPGAPVRLMIAGHVRGVTGARLRTASRDACDGRACRSPADVQVLDLVPEAGAAAVVLDVEPLAPDVLAAPGDARYRHLVVRAGQLAWQALDAAPGRAAAPPADVVLADRAGTPLWRDGAPLDAARAAGLDTLLGVHAGQPGSVAALLGRLPGGPHAARLTLDLRLQAAAQAALDCIGLRRGRWDGTACAEAGPVPPGRQAGLVLLDTETGDILAAAGAGMPAVDAANWREARDFDRIDPAASPLRLPALQHDGGAERSPGSTFKIVSALGLELAARSDRRLDALLDGLPLAAINDEARMRGFAFRTDAPAYPLDGRARITNFRDQGLDRRAQDGRLGLAQALTYSLNTWFAWTGELADRSLLGRPDGGVPDLQPLDPGALDTVRPIVAMARRLGFGQALRLDGGLLPADYPPSAWDALQATPAGIDPVHTRHELRQMAIGLRMQATPLQMALVAGAVGEGRVIAPRLLAELDGRTAPPAAGPALDVRLDRIRAGMKGVVDAGTAAGAFRAPALAGIRRGLSGKTGTAPVGDGSRATVWFTGWLEPHSVPGQAHRLAIAVFVSRSAATGGEHAAPVAAAVLGALAGRQHAEPSK